MAPKVNEHVYLERQATSLSDFSAVTTTSTSEEPCKPSLRQAKASGPSIASIRNFFLSAAIYYIGIYHTKWFVPNHEHVFQRDHPYFETTSGDVILNFEWNHPLVYPASVPSKLLHRTCVALPILILLILHYWLRSSWNCTMASTSGLLSAIGICEIFTHVLKFYVLRRRPNFYALCGWDGNACTNIPKKVLEAQLSFPSGHSSFSWCGMTFLVWVFWGQLRLGDRTATRNWEWKRWAMWIVALIPWSWSSYVATSRIADYWHHASDVIAGVWIGFVCATLSYHTLFPHILSPDSHLSYAEWEVQKSK